MTGGVVIVAFCIMLVELVMGSTELVVAAAVPKHDNMVKSQVIPEQQSGASVNPKSLSPQDCSEVAQTGAVEEVTGGVVMVAF